MLAKDLINQNTGNVAVVGQHDDGDKFYRESFSNGGALLVAISGKRCCVLWIEGCDHGNIDLSFSLLDAALEYLEENPLNFLKSHNWKAPQLLFV